VPNFPRTGVVASTSCPMYLRPLSNHKGWYCASLKWAILCNVYSDPQRTMTSEVVRTMIRVNSVGLGPPVLEVNKPQERCRAFSLQIGPLYEPVSIEGYRTFKSSRRSSEPVLVALKGS